MKARALASLAVASMVLAGCGILPASPQPAPSTYLPEPSPSEGDTPGALSPDGFTAAQRMTVRVRNIGCGFLSTGSGFALDAHTLVTNRHVVENAATVEVSTYDGRIIQAKAASTTTVADIAIVSTEQSLGAAFAVRAAADPVRGDVITVVGYPNGGRLTTASGVVLGASADPLGGAVGPVLASSVSIAPGSSGSPAFNEKGEVVGVIYAKNFSNQSFLVPISTLNTLLTEKSLLVPATDSCPT